MTTWLRGVVAAASDMQHPATWSQRLAVALLLVVVVLMCGLGSGPA